ncbi:hypothetical protein SAMN04515695_4293 [Pseudovibrio sp. Tun.PSC04-5.I4]|nr:hypothetical protein SAMN04515695_4293 [Pseudovibrio sp. Tun.PSC04-5.I4]
MKCILIVMFALLSSNACADTLEKHVAANRTAKLDVYGYYIHESCTSSIPRKVSFVKKPEHGIIRFVQSRSAIARNAGKCAGKVTNELIMYYSPDKDYRGTDKVVTKFRMLSAGQTIYGGHTYEIDVQ